MTAQPVDVVDLGPDALVWTGHRMDEPDGAPVTVVVNGDAVLQISPAAFPPD